MCLRLRERQVSKNLFAASSSCYGLASTPTREDHPISPQYPYALSKYQGEQAVFHWHQVYDLPVNSIRIFNAYGTRVRTTGAYGAVFGVFFKQKLEGKHFTVVGDGTQTRDFIYVTDFVRGLLLALEKCADAEPVNIASGRLTTIGECAEIILREGGNTDTKLQFDPSKPTTIPYRAVYTDDGNRRLGFKPEVSLEDGLRRTIEWYRANGGEA